MNSRTDILDALRGALPQLRESYAVRDLQLFGSWARGEQTADSDVDLIVSFVEVPDYWVFSDLRGELEVLLGRRVDLVTAASLRPAIRERAVAEAVFA